MLLPGNVAISCQPQAKMGIWGTTLLFNSINPNLFFIVKPKHLHLKGHQLLGLFKNGPLQLDLLYVPFKCDFIPFVYKNGFCSFTLVPVMTFHNLFLTDLDVQMVNRSMSDVTTFSHELLSF